MRSASRSRRYRWTLAGAGAVVALGCGSDAEEPTTIAEAPAGSGDRSVETETDGLTPVGPLPTSNGTSSDGEASGAGVSGLFDGEEAQDDSACVDQFVGATERPPVIQFVVDTSGSMAWVAGTERLPRAGERSKWEITEEALVGAIASMPDAAAVGVSYYPNTDGGGRVCIDPQAAAPLAPLTAEQRALIERVNAAQTPRGGTPTHAAYEFGVQELAASALAGPRFLVLITDGIPTFTLECDGDGRTRVDGAPLVASVDQRYRDESVRTFVIGSPGSEPAREELSKMALVGGTGAPGCEALAPGACHFDMTGQADFSTGLRAALGDITESTLGCNYAVPEPPGGQGRLDRNAVSVVIESGGMPVSEFQRATSPDCESGWEYSADGATIQLCSSSCDELTRLSKQDPGIAVRVKFRCVVTPA